jgi:hypothetical protein
MENEGPLSVVSCFIRVVVDSGSEIGCRISKPASSNFNS